MGRVRRYKKVKSCDPFAKKSSKKDGGDIGRKSKHGANYDQDPDIFEKKQRNKDKKRKHTEEFNESELNFHKTILEQSNEVIPTLSMPLEDDDNQDVSIVTKKSKLDSAQVYFLKMLMNLIECVCSQRIIN